MIEYIGSISKEERVNDSFITLHVYTYEINSDSFVEHQQILCTDVLDAEFEFYDLFQPGYIIPSYIGISHATSIP